MIYIITIVCVMFGMLPFAASELAFVSQPTTASKRVSTSIRSYIHQSGVRDFLQYQSIAGQIRSSSRLLMTATNSNDEEEASSSSSSSLDMGELQRRIEQQQNQYYDLFLSEEDEEDDDDDDNNNRRPENVFIIIFNVGTPDQGVHTIEFPKGSGLNTLLAFESEDECNKFSEMLKQDTLHFTNPTPMESSLNELDAFCSTMQLPIKIVPIGKNLRPPADNVDEFTLDPNISKKRLQMEDQLIMLDSKKEEEEDEKNIDEIEDSWQ